MQSTIGAYRTFLNSRQNAIKWLFLDRFDTAQATPITSPRTAEPGPGTGVKVDAENKISINSSNRLLINGGKTTLAWGDPGFFSNASFSRVVGRTVYGKLQLAATNKNFMFGWAATQGFVTTDSVLFGGNGINYYSGGPASIVDIYSAATDYQVAVVLRSIGYLILIKGGAFPAWTLLYVENAENTSNLYAACSGRDAVIQVDEFGVFDLPAPFTTDAGLQLSKVSSTTDGYTTSGPADVAVEHTFVAATGVNKSLMLRWTDDNNCWLIRQNMSNNQLEIVEKVGGTETVRNNTGAFGGWTNGTSYRFFVKMNGSSIRVTLDGLTSLVWTSATSNQTATGIKVDKAGSNLITWPLYVPTAGLPV